MDAVPLKVIGKCVAGDEELFRNMDAALLRGLPEIHGQAPVHTKPVAIVASGPSVASQVDVIRQMKQAGTPVVAVRGAHDWLVDNGILPDYAVSVDPLPNSWTCFRRKHPDVHYLIASQCPASMFDHLNDMRVTIWHPYITKGQTHPKGKMIIGGGTTSGLRAISLFYVGFGCRHFALFGFDSCLNGNVLRIDGSGVKPGAVIQEVRLDPDGEVFYCNAEMALQAQHFQDYYDWIPDAEFYPYGEGLIPAIIRKREENLRELEKAHAFPVERNDRISFIHSWDEKAASYRYRAMIPARELGASLNDLTAGTLIFTKPQAPELMTMARAKAKGQWVVVDFCDDHFDWPYYAEALRLADAVTCNTAVMAAKIQALGRAAAVIPDPYEFSLEAPHCKGMNLLWFGHPVNSGSLHRIASDLADYPLRIVTDKDRWPDQHMLYIGNRNIKEYATNTRLVQWSKERMFWEFQHADIVILPATENYKSANRAVEAIRQGCFVVAEPHPALMQIPGIWIGNIKDGIEWTQSHLPEANERLGWAQKYVTENYSPKICSAMWRTAMRRPTTSDAATSTGTDGSTSMDLIQAPI